jgi:hypothetical protein
MAEETRGCFGSVMKAAAAEAPLARDLRQFDELNGVQCLTRRSQIPAAEDGMFCAPVGLSPIPTVEVVP